MATFQAVNRRNPSGTLVLGTTQKTLFSPRVWVIAALLCFAGFVLIGYHQDQITAKLALDEMAGKSPNAAEVALEYEIHRQVLLLVSFTMILAAIFLKYRQLSRARQPSTPKSGTTSRAEVSQSAAFQPIRTQEEIIGEDSAADQNQSVGKRVSRVVLQIAQSTYQVARVVKSRQ